MHILHIAQVSYSQQTFDPTVNTDAQLKPWAET